MKLNHFSISVFLIFISIATLAQPNITNAIKVSDSISYWKSKNTVGFDLSEIAFVNWNAGGQSSVSGLLKGDFNRIYKRDNVKWFNELIIRYGVNKQDGFTVRKTDDAFQFNSTF